MIVTSRCRPQRARFALGAGLVLATTGVLATPSGATTPVPAPEPAPAHSTAPEPGPARTLSVTRGDGRRIRVSWPSGHRTVAPGTRVPVRISQPRSSERKLTVSLLRISAKGRILKSVQRTRIVRGEVAVGIPDGAGRRYSLRLLRGGKIVRRMTIRTPASVAPKPAPAAPSPNGGSTWPACAAGRVDGRIEFGAPSVVRGEPLPFAVLNTGEACFERVGVVGLERWQPETSTWVTATMLSLPQTLAYYTVPAGQSDRSAVAVPADAEPGTYRMTVELRRPAVLGALAPAADAVPIAATFVATAAPEPAAP